METANIIEQSLETNETVSLIQETGEVVETDSGMARAIQALGLSKENKIRLQDYEEELQQKLVEESPVSARFIIGLELTEKSLTEFYAYSDNTRKSLLEVAEVIQVRKILRHSLSDVQVAAVLTFKPNIREVMIKESTELLLSILSFEFEDSEAVTLLNYGEETRQELLETQDKPLVKSLLSLGLDEEELEIILPGITRNVAAEVKLPDEDKTQLTNDKGEELQEETVVSGEIVKLLDTSTENDNPNIVPTLYEIGDGAIDDLLLAEGVLGNDLLTDVVLHDALDADRMFDLEDLVQNYFYLEVGLLFEEWIGQDNRQSGIDFSGQALAGREVTIEPGLLELGAYFSAGNKELFITAAGDMAISGNVVFSSIAGAKEEIEQQLSLMAAGHFIVEEGSSIQFADGGLHFGSRETSEFISVSMESGGYLNVASLEDLVFKNSELQVRAGDSIHLSAFNELSINGLNFSDNVREIYMQAITIDLRNIYFPGGSSVTLQSQFGGINGIYPTFGQDDRQVGRVNFIENVGYDKTTINNQAIFDQFQDRIRIVPLQ